MKMTKRQKLQLMDQLNQMIASIEKYEDGACGAHERGDEKRENRYKAWAKELRDEMQGINTVLFILGYRSVFHSRDDVDMPGFYTIEEI